MDRMHSEKASDYGPKDLNLRHVVPGNVVANNMAWEQVFEWESMHGGGAQCGGIRLISFAKFKGNRSPGAMWAVVLGHKPPYERQDWIIDRCGKVNRYIIDFYKRPRDPKDPTSPEDRLVVHARPSIRNWDGAKLRARRFLSKITFGRF